MAAPDLEKYIQTARTQGVADPLIRTTLIKSGWGADEIDAAMVPSTTSSLGVPPPPVPHFGMWVAFKYIILFICLYVSFTALGGILHSAVDQYIPDKLAQYTSYYSDFLMPAYMACILVAFPIFAVLFMVLKREVAAKPGVKNLRARKILIYITLVGTFLIMISHLIGTIYGFLGGNATLRSFAHLMVTLLVAGSVFIYLLFEVKEDRKQT